MVMVSEYKRVYKNLDIDGRKIHGTTWPLWSKNLWTDWHLVMSKDGYRRWTVYQIK